DRAENNIVDKLHSLVVRPVGVNLEPVDINSELQEERLELELGRQANIQTFKRVEELGFDFICLTGNPGTGVPNQQIIEAIEEA
ncbi:haloacid dehalogenase-like hydrolase, partial [Enterococcus faecalis]